MPSLDDDIAESAGACLLWNLAPSADKLYWSYDKWTHTAAME